jgi:predicted dehydrogenase
MTDRLRWGILGTGNIAHSFANQLPLSRTGTLVAVASRRPETAAAFAAEYGLELSYGGYQALLDDDTVDAVYVSTPHPGHAEWAVRAAEAGKHVLCEKPLSLNHSWAMAMVEAARRNDVFLMEAYMYRCHPRTARLVELVRGGAIGTLHQIQASFAFRTGTVDPAGRILDPALAGGGILDVGGYPVSLARLLVGAAHGTPFENPDLVTGAGRLGATGVDEWATATLGFADGTRSPPASGWPCPTRPGCTAARATWWWTSRGYRHPTRPPRSCCTARTRTTSRSGSRSSRAPSTRWRPTPSRGTWPTGRRRR